jgi:hypothetical protein
MKEISWLQINGDERMPQRSDSFLGLNPTDREKIILDNNMCPFCLWKLADQECYGKYNIKKPTCRRAEFRKKCVRSLHDLMGEGADFSEHDRVQGRQ